MACPNPEKLNLDPKFNLPEQDVEMARRQANKALEDNYVILTLRYYEYVMPFKDAEVLINAFKHAEGVEDITYSYKKIIPLNKDHTLSMRVISREEYIELKMRHILNLTEEPKPF